MWSQLPQWPGSLSPLLFLHVPAMSLAVCSSVSFSEGHPGAFSKEAPYRSSVPLPRLTLFVAPCVCPVYLLLAHPPALDGGQGPTLVFTASTDTCRCATFAERMMKCRQRGFAGWAVGGSSHMSKGPGGEAWCRVFCAQPVVQGDLGAWALVSGGW